MRRVRELWRYKEMIISLVKRDLKSRYKESVLGFFWMLLNPLLQLCVYTIVFSVIMRMGIEKYYLFLFVALVPWTFFSTCLSAGSTVIISQQDMIKKIYFPREVLPISFVIAQFVNMLLSFIVVFAVVFISGTKLDVKSLIFLPCIMIIEFVLALGCTMIVSAITVYFRDIEHIVSVLTMAWMYLTPVIYSVDMVPMEYVKLFYLNPMTSIIIAYRDILYYGQAPQMETLLNAVIMGVIFLVIGFVGFDKMQRHFAEEL